MKAFRCFLALVLLTAPVYADTTAGRVFLGMPPGNTSPGAATYQMNATGEAVAAVVVLTKSGTIDITNEDDTTVSALPVLAGATLSMRPKKITAASSATVYGIYDNP